MIAYVGPFGVFAVLLVVQGYTAPLGRWEPLLRVLVLTAALAYWSRRVLDFRVRRVLPSVGMGLLVFLVWIAPEQLLPQYREHWLFQNALTGGAGQSLASELRQDPFSLTFRTIRAALLVPVIEELFWRSWLMRYAIESPVERVPLGTYTARSFWLVAVLFASEHGTYWDVGLAAGMLYNAWMVRTRSLGDCILAHAVTNACLCAFVLVTRQWHYWQ